MTVNDLREILRAELHCCEGVLGNEIKTACGSDMMSEVLASVKDQSVLLSGLANAQVIRTAEMMDIQCVVFLRGKRPTFEMIGLAEKANICVLTTSLQMFNACGILYAAGLRGGEEDGQ